MSIQRRLSLGLAAAIIVVGIILIQLTIWIFDLVLRNYFERDLQNEAEALVVPITRKNGYLELESYRVSPVFNGPYSGHYFVIDSDNESWRSRSLWDEEFPSAKAEGLATKLRDGPVGQKLLIYRGDFQKFGQDFRITVARDYTPMITAYQQIQYLGIACVTFALLLIIFLQRIAIVRAFRPLGEVCDQVSQLQEGLRTSLEGQVPSELEPLVDQINNLLLHTESQLKRSRNALGNLGHALKTPLAVLMSVIARNEFNAVPATQKLIQEQLQAIEQLLARELGKARMAGEVLPGAYFVCDVEMSQLFDTLTFIHDNRVALTWETPEACRLPWNREDMLELLGNLLDNACKWSKGNVLLTVIKEPNSYQLIIDDDGRGIEPENYGDVLNRGVRLDEQVTGHGLGLGIVRDIIDSWQGEMTLDRSHLGGLRVIVTLPKQKH